MLDVHKSSFDYLFLPRRRVVDWFAKLLAGVPQGLHPLQCVGGLFKRAVVRHEASLDALELDVSVGYQGFEHPLEEKEVVRYASFQLAAVDEVELLLVHPVILKVVNFENTVRGCPKEIVSKAWAIGGRPSTIGAEWG